jgi:hypothetical protein
MDAEAILHCVSLALDASDGSSEKGPYSTASSFHPRGAIWRAPVGPSTGCLPGQPWSRDLMAEYILQHAAIGATVWRSSVVVLIF